MSTQPEALRLADLIDNDLKKAAHHDEAAAELRRLYQVATDQHTEIYGLRAKLRLLHAEMEALRTALAGPEQWHCDDCGGTDPECPNKPQRTEPEQEPVAWRYKFARGVRWDFAESDPAEWRDLDVTAEPLYTHPPQRKPLTDEELKPIADQYEIVFGGWVTDFARAIERAHGIGGEA